MRVSTTEKLRRFYQLFSGDDRVLIVINADPDAIASALAIKRLLWRKVSGATISNVNVVSRPDNISMIRLLGVDLVHADKIEESTFSRFIIVDSQPSHHEAFSRFAFNAVIDHHPDTGIQAEFKDIRPSYGATASILTEYLRSAGIKPSVKLATGLLYAIKTDTHNFTRKTLIEDVRAFQYQFRHANMHLASKIENADLRLDYLEYFRYALKSMHLRRGRIFVHLGPVINPDICVVIAEFFMRVNSIKWSIISGVFEGKLTIVFRNDGVRKDAGKIAEQTFGCFGSAGGHKSMARAELSLDVLRESLNIKNNKVIQNWIIDKIEKRSTKKKHLSKNKSKTNNETRQP